MIRCLACILMSSYILTTPQLGIAFASGCMCCQEFFAKIRHQVAQQGRFPSAYLVCYCAASRMNTASLYSYISNTTSLAAFPVRDHLSIFVSIGSLLQQYVFAKRTLHATALGLQRETARCSFTTIQPSTDSFRFSTMVGRT